MKKVYAFDMGKASIGYCVREGHNLLEVNSIIIDKDHSDISSIRERRRVYKTLWRINQEKNILIKYGLVVDLKNYQKMISD